MHPSMKPRLIKSAGRVLFDGIDLRDFHPTEWRCRVSVIFQDYVWYHLLTAQEKFPEYFEKTVNRDTERLSKGFSLEDAVREYDRFSS